MTRRPEVIALELGTFRFPEPELSHRQGVVMGYAIRRAAGIFLFDTGLGFGNAELDERYHPVAMRIGDALAEGGIDVADVTAVPAPDHEAYGRSTERLHALEPARVHFRHDQRSGSRASD